MWKNDEHRRQGLCTFFFLNTCMPLSVVILTCVYVWLQSGCEGCSGQADPRFLFEHSQSLVRKGSPTLLSAALSRGMVWHDQLLTYLAISCICKICDQHTLSLVPAKRKSAPVVSMLSQPLAKSDLREFKSNSSLFGYTGMVFQHLVGNGWCSWLCHGLCQDSFLHNVGRHHSSEISLSMATNPKKVNK